MNTQEVLRTILRDLDLDVRQFSERIDYPASKLYDIQRGKTIKLKDDLISRILSVFPNYNRIWLITGEGDRFVPQNVPSKKPVGKISEQPTPTRDNYDITTAQQPTNNQPQKHLLPFYDDVNSRGGLGTYVEDTNTPAQPAEWIDAGDWFHEATAAIRHYGDSMIEYPSGSILALKQVTDLRLIIPGRNYVIETTEFRVTKQLQPHADHLMAYSTNRETYPDGSLIHSPFAIPLETVRTIWQILGCVIKEYSGGAVYIHK